jgi:hypothetical protein
MNSKAKYFLFGVLLSIGVSLLLGIPTALVPTGFFVRMTPITILDYVLLALTSVLLASYVSYSFYLKNKAREEKSGYIALGGTFAGVLGFGCPICNVLLVSVFGSTALLVFFEPYRHYLGFLVIGLFGLAFYLKTKKCKECSQ